MLTKNGVSYVLDRLHYIENEFMLLGILFFILAASIIVFPEIIQILFVIGFFLMSFSFLFISIKLHHIRYSVSHLGSRKK